MADGEARTSAFIDRLSAVCPGVPSSFDAAFYVAQLPTVLARTIDPLWHYWDVGCRVLLAPHPCFDMEFLYAASGAKASHGRPPSAGPMPPAAVATPALLAVLEAREPPYASPNVLFEPDLYAAHLPPRALGNIAPFEHFLRFWPEFRVPFSRYFDVDFYGMANPHVRKAGLNPLVHYCSQPIELRSDPNPMIHGKYYAATNAHVRGDPLVHYVRFGMAAGCMPNPYAEQELRLSMTDGTRSFQLELLKDYIAVAD